jgi:hypothetical protein
MTWILIPSNSMGLKSGLSRTDRPTVAGPPPEQREEREMNSYDINGPMSGEEHNAWDMGYRLGNIELNNLSEMTIYAMHDAMNDIMERNTVEPDHPGNMRGTDLAMIAGRLAAYDESLTA